jgi:hypothetical protein
VPTVCDRHEFTFEFDKAFTHQLIEKFEASPVHQLTTDVAPRRNGIYALYRNGEIVYAGKALPTTLKRRLSEHYRKITSRQNVNVEEMTCRFLAIDSDWFVRAGEYALIKTYTPVWNKSGVGSHVPGAGRPGVRISKFDKLFPPKKR